MRKVILLAALASALLLPLVACGGGDDSSSTTTDGEITSDASRGESLYQQTAIGAASAPGCVTCHSLEPGVQLVGPSHAGIGTRAETAVPGKAAEEYLEESIAEPDAEVTEGFASGVMYQNYKTDLSDAEIADLVAFLMTLK
jgi:nitric oxide reductase subunit C